MEASLSVFTFAYLGAIRVDNNVTGKLSWCQFVHVTELTIRRTKNIMAETFYYIDFRCLPAVENILSGAFRYCDIMCVEPK